MNYPHDIDIILKTQRGHSSTMDRTEEGPIRARFYQSLERTLQKKLDSIKQIKCKY